MNTLIPWGKFNLVGAMGMVLQLAVLALLNRWAGGHGFRVRTSVTTASPDRAILPAC